MKNNKNKFKTFCSNLWRNLKNNFSDLWSNLKEIFQLLLLSLVIVAGVITAIAIVFFLPLPFWPFTNILLTFLTILFVVSLFQTIF